MINVNIRNFYARRRANIKVLRVKNISDSGKAEKAGGIAASSFWSKYSVIKAIKSAFPWIRNHDDPTTFCSMLVGAAYDASGLPIVRHSRPNKITPKHIYKSQILHDITESVVIYGDVEEFVNMERLEHDRAHNDARDQSAIMQDLYDEFAAKVTEIAIRHELPVMATRNLFDLLFFMGTLSLNAPQASRELRALDVDMAPRIQMMADIVDEVWDKEREKLTSRLIAGDLTQDDIEYLRDMYLSSLRDITEREASVREWAKYFGQAKLASVSAIIAHHANSLNGLKQRAFFLESYLKQIDAL